LVVGGGFWMLLYSVGWSGLALDVFGCVGSAGVISSWAGATWSGAGVTSSGARITLSAAGVFHGVPGHWMVLEVGLC
jgi:hypothetical protein